MEIANYSPRLAVARLSVAVGGDPPAEVSRIDLAAGEVGRVRFSVPRGEEVRLRLTGISDGVAGDALALDDEAILLPERGRAVRVALEIGSEELRERIRGVLVASERAVFSPADRAELVIADGPVAAGKPARAWRLRLATGGPAKPYLGPFVLSDAVDPVHESRLRVCADPVGDDDVRRSVGLKERALASSELGEELAGGVLSVGGDHDPERPLRGAGQIDHADIDPQEAQHEFADRGERVSGRNRRYPGLAPRAAAS